MLILDKLWHGDLDPAGRSVKRIPGHPRHQEEVFQAEERLQELLSPEGKARLEDFDTAWVHLAAAMEQDAFITGFRMAGLLILDILCGADAD